jgi:L-iditol 2-dehydrogenase
VSCILHHPKPGGTLRAAILTGPEQIELRDLTDLFPERGDVLIRVRSVGVCGTDLSIFSGKIPVAYPRVLGHEIVGEVMDPGPSNLTIGARVIVDPGLACGACVQCREGRTNICTRGGLMGRDVDGGLQEMLVASSSHLHALPDAVDDKAASLLQVLATCVHAQRLVSIFPGDRVVILGLGVTGLLHLQLAKLRGAGAVVGVTRSAEKLELAGRLGADVLVPADGRETDAVATATGGADVVIESAGTAATLARAIEMARVGGRILSYGTLTDTAGELPFYDIYYKELAIIGARSARAEDFPASIDTVAAGHVVLEPLLAQRFTLEAAGEAIRAGSAPGALKVVVDV